MTNNEWLMMWIEGKLEDAVAAGDDGAAARWRERHRLAWEAYEDEEAAAARRRMPTWAHNHEEGY